LWLGFLLRYVLVWNAIFHFKKKIVNYRMFRIKNRVSSCFFSCRLNSVVASNSQHGEQIQGQVQKRAKFKRKEHKKQHNWNNP
jgi:hypothetical protein